jgi:MFS family permease
MEPKMATATREAMSISGLVESPAGFSAGAALGPIIGGGLLTWCSWHAAILAPVPFGGGRGLDAVDDRGHGQDRQSGGDQIQLAGVGIPSWPRWSCPSRGIPTPASWI